MILRFQRSCINSDFVLGLAKKEDGLGYGSQTIFN